MEDEGDLLAQAESFEEGFKIIDALLQGKSVAGIDRFVGEAATDVIGDDHPVLIPQGKDEIAVVEGPGRVAMEHDHGFALPFIKIVVFQALEVVIVPRKGVELFFHH